MGPVRACDSRLPTAVEKDKAVELTEIFHRDAARCRSPLSGWHWFFFRKTKITEADRGAAETKQGTREAAELGSTCSIASINGSR